MVTIVFNGSGRKIYINGVDQTASGGAVTTLPSDVSGVVRIGNSVDTMGYTFNGYIDEVRFYDAIISAFQIQEQYYAGLNSLLAKGVINLEDYKQKLSKI